MTMFLTRSRGRGKITVEFFSALMLFKVWVRSLVRIVTIVVRNMELWQCNGCDDNDKSMRAPGGIAIVKRSCFETSPENSFQYED